MVGAMFVATFMFGPSGVEAGHARSVCLAACDGLPGGAAVRAACAASCPLWCFEDNTVVVKVAENCRDQLHSHCLSRGVVQDLVFGDLVLAEDRTGSQFVTSVVQNLRVIGRVDAIKIEVNSSSSDPLIVTGNHLVMSRSKTESEYFLRRADALLVGQIVSVHGRPTEITQLEPVELDHRNHLVTGAGSVVANGIHVSTVCGDYAEDKFANVPAGVALEAWRESHWMDASPEIV